MNTLALYIYPLPRGTSYDSTDLSNDKTVIGLFDYCQIFEAVISKEGWRFLINHYGYESLFQINRESDWLDCSSLAEFIAAVEAEMELSPNTL